MELLRTKKPNRESFEGLKSNNETFLFMSSKFKFLADHFGLRPGCVHIILSNTGSGKTTLGQSILVEMLLAKKKVLVYSTEETVSDVETKLAYTEVPLDVSNLNIFHEQDLLKRIQDKHDNSKEFLDQLKSAFVEVRPDVFIFDNITTSLFYDQNKKIAVDVAMGLKALCQQLNIPFLIIAHTGSHIKSNMLFDSSSIRGFRNIANTAQYVYCLSRFISEGAGYTKQTTILFTDKSRNHDEASRSYYKLFYDGQTKLYSGDEKIGYGAVKKVLRGV